MRVDLVQQLACDPRLIDIARRFIGGTPLPFTATLFDKSPTSNWLVAWHQDIALPLRRQVDISGWGPWSRKAGQLYALAPASALARIVALRVHIDDSTAENGPLVRTIEPVDCVVDRGGVIVMRPLVVHASSKSRSALARRVLHIEYASDLTLGGGIELAIA
jgi:hypothetical protein